MSLRVFESYVDEYLSEVRSLREVPRALEETSLYPALDRLLNGFLASEQLNAMRAVQQVRTDLGVPDFVLDVGGPIGYVEAKKPTVDLDALTGRDRSQRDTYLHLPNVLYTNYRDFQLYEDGQLVAAATLGPLDVLDHRREGAPLGQGVDELRRLLVRFASHRVLPPRSAQELATGLARATRVLRDVTLTSLKTDPAGPVARLRDDWKRILFPEMADDAFADAYAQTISYGLLTARLQSEGSLTLETAQVHLSHRHAFMGSALRYLTDPSARITIGWAVDAVLQIVDGASLELFRSARLREDPLLYFYEDFLAAYDEKLRKKRGVYFTPASVVGFQVRAVADLTDELGRHRFLADDVVALDPAAGTGTYLLALLDETAARVQERYGDGALAAAAAEAAEHLNGFEILVGPYTVAHQRLGARLARLGASEAEIRVYLTDTLDQPGHLPLQQLSFFERELGEERERADLVKTEVPVVIVIGNPPYERSRGRPKGDWLQQQMRLFTLPVRREARVNLKNLADSYVHFFRWALWKLFESLQPHGPRLFSFISNRTYLDGDAFEGVRLALRQRFDDIWVVDLGGESRGGQPEENVFDIRVGVAIVVALRRDASQPMEGEAHVRYARIRGTRQEKEEALKANLVDIEWTVVRRPPGEPFVPPEQESWTRWPSLAELMPVRQSGVQTKRDALVVAPTRDALAAKLQGFVEQPPEVRQRQFHETRDRKCPTEPSIDSRRIRPYGYRPLDRRWFYDDRAFVDFPRPRLHEFWHDGQRALCTLPKGHGSGPCVVLQTEIPDLHAFRGSYGGHAFPLWLDPPHTEPNLARGLLGRLSAHLRLDVSADRLFAYLFGLLNTPTYQPLFEDGLRQGFPRIPFPVSSDVFEAMAELGSKLFRAHQLGPPEGRGARIEGTAGPIAKIDWDAGRVRVSGQAWVEPVTRAAWDYAVSGHRVIREWLLARKGLDLSRDIELLDELLRVVAAVETSVRMGPALDRALAPVVQGETLGKRALLPLDIGQAAEKFARIPGALEDAQAESDEWDELSDEALLLAEPE